MIPDHKHYFHAYHTKSAAYQVCLWPLVELPNKELILYLYGMLAESAE